jgi:hypothetical protein
VKYVGITDDQALQALLAVGTPDVIARGLAKLGELARNNFVNRLEPTVSDLLYRSAYSSYQYIRKAVAGKLLPSYKSYLFRC